MTTGNGQWATGRGRQPDVASGQKGNKAEELQAWVSPSPSPSPLDAFRHFCFLIIFQMFRGPALAGRRTLQVQGGGQGSGGLWCRETEETTGTA